jgi:hypothetical protein
MSGFIGEMVSRYTYCGRYTYCATVQKVHSSGIIVSIIQLFIN